MPIIECTNAACKTKMQVGDDAAGKQFRCPACKTVFTVPSTKREAVSAAPRPAAARAGGSGQVSAAHATSKPAAASTPTACPACGSDLLAGAVACMDCGFLIQSAPSPGESDGAAVSICPNPACGVANPAGERNCQRCSTPLPYPKGHMIHGKYRIEKLLAMGGFGAVYLGFDAKNGDRPVAIKDMICADPQEFSIRLNFFRREAEILRSLTTVNIVPRVYDLIEQGQSAHLVMEFIRGQDLLKLMEANNNAPFPMDQVIEWAKSICDVLQHMHTQTPPLVHRDLKPDNIMLLEDRRTIKMIDFGTARDLGRTREQQKAAKTRVYTEGYAPPEQIVGKPEPRSDLFALAGTLYHLATGKAPEGFYTAKEIDAQLANGGSIPKEHRWFYELVKINLAEDVNERYFSAREIRADLDKRQVTREVACPKCGQVNKARDHVYCMKCAEALTDATPPCYHCGKTNRMGSRCCIHCGNRLR
jgi:predicted Ser/Thr protein kinase